MQTLTGKEDRVVSLISRNVGAVVTDCFVPRCEVMKRVRGSWVRQCDPLLPGYVFFETDRPSEVDKALRDMPGFHRLLGVSGDSFIPLTPDDNAWLAVHTDGNNHTMGMSEGMIEGDRVIVTSGPLRGREVQIAKIDRHKRLAWLTVDLFGRQKNIRVGLEIVSKR